MDPTRDEHDSGRTTIRTVIDQLDLSGRPVRVGRQTAPAPPGAGAGRLGRYPVSGQLGAGGMGQILEIVDSDLGRELAAKVVLGEADSLLLGKFVVEAQVTGQLEHPNIVPVHELGLADDGRIYFTMKRVDGEDLEALLTRIADAGPGAAGLPSLVELLQTFLKVCDAIAFAHSRGVIHRDLKPANIMIGQFGEVLVMDWGLAKVLDRPELADGAARPVAVQVDGQQPARTMDGAVMGTPAYMPPEQARGEIDRLDARCDIYSLGAVLYEILTLEPPVIGETVHEILAAIVRGEVTPPSVRSPQRAVPWELEAAVMKAMETDPAARYASVERFKADLQAFLEGRTLGAARYSIRQRAVKWIRRHPALCGSIAAVLLLGLGMLGFFRWQARARLARRSAEVIREAEELQQRVARRLRRLERVEPRALMLAGGEVDPQKARAWFRARSDALQALERLAALELKAPTEAARRAIGLERVNRQRIECGRQAWVMARDLADYTLAESWIGRAAGAGFSAAQQQRELAAVDAARARREAQDTGQARSILLAADRAQRGGEKEWYGYSLNQLVRLRSRRAVVRLLLDPAHLDSKQEWRRRLAIEALGLIGDRHTRGPQGQDAVEALCQRLQRVDLQLEMETGVRIARALGDLQDARAYETLERKRWQSGQEEHFWISTRTALSRIPLPAGHRAKPVPTALSVDELWRRAGRKLDQGNLDGAIADYDRALAIDPANLSCRVNRATAYLQQGKLDRALADFNRAIEKKAFLDVAHAGRSAVHERQGQFRLALADLDRVVALDPNHARSYLNRARVRRKVGDLDGVIADCTQALVIDPRNADAHNQRAGSYYFKGDLARASADAERAIELDPRLAPAYTYRGMIHQAGGRLDAAIADFDRAIQLDRASGPAYCARGMCLLYKGQPAAALRDIEQAISLDPQNPNAYLGRALLREKAGKLAAALKDYDRLVQLDPSKYLGWYQRGLVRFRLGQRDGAVADLEQAARIAPRRWQPWAALGQVQARLGRRERAAQALRKAVALIPPGHPKRKGLEAMLQQLSGGK